MHSTKSLSSSSFSIVLDDRRVTLEELFPGFEERDRLGVVVRHPCGAVGASALILATITAFYDIQRLRSSEFFVYPDYFLFHVGQPLGDHGMLDIFPEHKEVVVEDDPEEILRAVNDRAVTRLLVEDASAGSSMGSPSFARETLASTRIRTAFAYSSGGRVDRANVSVAGNTATESYVSAVLERSREIDADTRERIRTERKSLFEEGAPVETYRRLGVDGALGMLAQDGKSAGVR